MNKEIMNDMKLLIDAESLIVEISKKGSLLIDAESLIKELNLAQELLGSHLQDSE